MNTVENISPIVTANSNPGNLKRFNIVLTSRGLLVLMFLCYLIASPILKETDIIAAVIFYSICAIITAFFLVCLYNGITSRKSLKLKIYPPSDNALFEAHQGGVTSGNDCTLVVKTSPVSVFPGFDLRIQIEFEYGLKPFMHLLSGTSTEERILIQNINFPHRGNWKVRMAKCSLSDRLGLTNYNWDINEEDFATSIKVAPPIDHDSTLPTISSSNRSGDSMPDAREKNGDPYDLKPYDPSDGVKKILWKVYAKSGELITRHPEASMTPEGQTVIFCVANYKDDAVCSAALAYVKALEKINIEIFFSCEGANRNSFKKQF